jgi:toxin ParE1/3/4
MHIKWSPLSQKDLHEIIAYTKEEMGEIRAETIVITILKIVEKISSFPALGKEGIKHGTREFLIPKTSLVIIYRIEEVGVTILRIFHTKRFRILCP